MISYNGFNIDERTFEIYDGTRLIFVAWWQRCSTLEDAKLMIDTSNKKAIEQMQQKPDLGKAFKTFCENEIENGAREAEEFQSWMENEHELLLMEGE